MTSLPVHKNLGVGPRSAEWLKRQYPRNRGKLIALDFRVHENTAWRWLSGVAPTTAHLEEMFERWGKPWLEFVFVDALERADSRLFELEDLNKKIREWEESRARAVEARTRVRSTIDRNKFQRVAPPRHPMELRRAQLIEGLAADTPPPRWRSMVWLRVLFSRFVDRDR
jgi:hypothetical protein